MSTSTLFGCLPKQLVLPAETAQSELYFWSVRLERRLEWLWGDKAPATLSRRARRRWSGRRLARAMKARRELRAVNALYVARGGILGDTWTDLPSTPTLKAAEAQLRVLYYFDGLLKSMLNRHPYETIADFSAAVDEATMDCESVYWRYWDSLE